MKTEISRFCVACSESLATLPTALDAAATQFEKRGSDLRSPLAALNDIRARLRSLTDKLGNQQAYLLIFGPLKSGKSTLMNAISGTYVSEVTSLPGYPCLVFVRNSEKPKFSITRYNGRESNFPDSVVLNDVVAEAHHSLAAQIRAIEERGEVFDPRINFPEAIRRVDIRRPVPALVDSGTVLVDTPGLYSRMNFGYDVLTREFRDSAACAVFVVKTDNLFLEQVFDEFNQLLDLFSRIFIVVNVDANKRDLAPDGTLRPSQESQHPGKVIEAFTTLSMGAPLRTAYEQGRVRIHAVDLLGAASSFLSGNGETSDHRAPFDAFQRDLTDYLNSSDYTRAFINDSLRQAATLCGEIRGIAAGHEIGDLRKQQERRVDHMRELDTQIAAADRLAKADWNAMFQPLRDDNQRGVEEATRAKTAQAREDMRQALNAWFSKDESLISLAESHWSASLTEAGRALASQSFDRITQLSNRTNAGLQPSESVLADMRTIGFSPAACGARGVSLLHANDDLTAYPVTITGEAIPVRKRFLDWLLFRSVATVRRRLFGADGAREIPTAEKDKRFDGATRAELAKLLDSAVNDRLPALPHKFSKQLAENYTTRCASEIQLTIKALRDKFASERASLQAPFELDSQVIAAAAQLENQSETIATGIHLLIEQETARAAASAPPPPPAGTQVDTPLAPIPSIAPLPLL